MRNATKEDTPRIGTSETQCVICWTMFSSDTVCETTKPYARHPDDAAKIGRVKQRETCIDPEDLGLVCRERPDGVCVWGREEEDAIKERMSRARAARSKKK